MSLMTAMSEKTAMSDATAMSEKTAVNDATAMSTKIARRSITAINPTIRPTRTVRPIRALGIAATLCAALWLTAAPPASAADGETLYKIYCTQCHGVEGYGNGVNVPAMSVQPRNHRDRGEMSARTDEELFKAIKHGGKSINKSVLMPTWGENLNDDEINSLVLYLRELCCSGG